MIDFTYTFLPKVEENEERGIEAMSAKLKISMTNNGSGPAILDSFRIFWTPLGDTSEQRKEVKNWRAFAEEAGNLPYPGAISIDWDPGNIVRPQTEYVILQIPADEELVLAIKEGKNLEIETRYQSLYEDLFEARLFPSPEQQTSAWKPIRASD